MRAHCPRCRRQHLFIKREINHLLHLVLAILTGGLWLVTWMVLCVGRVMRPWRCRRCGWHKPEFGSDENRQGNPRQRHDEKRALTQTRTKFFLAPWDI